MVTLSSYLICQTISFILSPKEYGTLEQRCEVGLGSTYRKYRFWQQKKKKFKNWNKSVLFLSIQKYSRVWQYYMYLPAANKLKAPRKTSAQYFKLTEVMSITMPCKISKVASFVTALASSSAMHFPMQFHSVPELM